VAIWRINAWMSFGRRGLPTGRDFHRQNRRNPLRCHRINVSGLTTTKALRQSNHWLRKLINQRVESSARWIALLEQGQLFAQKQVLGLHGAPGSARPCDQSKRIPKHAMRCPDQMPGRLQPLNQEAHERTGSHARESLTRLPLAGRTEFLRTTDAASALSSRASLTRTAPQLH